MAWPPPVQRTDFVNTTPQQNDHPAHHNSVAAAVNDLVTRLSTLAIVKTMTSPVSLGNVNVASRLTALDMIVPNRGTGSRWLVAILGHFQGSADNQDFEFWVTSTGAATPRLFSTSRHRVHASGSGWYGGALIGSWSTATATGSTTLSVWTANVTGNGGAALAQADRPWTAVAFDMGALIPGAVLLPGPDRPAVVPLIDDE
jgi:hypothetical protein